MTLSNTQKIMESSPGVDGVVVDVVVGLANQFTTILARQDNKQSTKKKTKIALDTNQNSLSMDQPVTCQHVVNEAEQREGVKLSRQKSSGLTQPEKTPKLNGIEKQTSTPCHLE